MARRIEVGYKKGITDPAGEALKKKIAELFGIKLNSVKVIDIYNIDFSLFDIHLKRLGDELFCDPIIQEYSFKEPISKEFNCAIEVGYRPGVTDNAGKTSSDAIKTMLGIDTKVYTSKQYILRGKISRKDAEKIAGELLANDLIEKTIIIDKPQKFMTPIIPKVTESSEQPINTMSLNVNDKELMEISKKGTLALTLEEMKIIRDYFKKLGRDPTDAELEILAQTWSEHCKHKIFNAKINYNDGQKTSLIDSLFKTYIKGATDKIAKETNFLVSVFKDNAGVIRFNKDNNIVFKVETHNSPSALDPYGGALTGIVGVNRDTIGTGIGSRPIFNTDIFCFAEPDYKKKIPLRLMHPRRIFEGVRKGVEHGGNKSGIPTVNGSIVFDERFLGKPLVYCGTGGIMPAKINGQDSSVKKIDPEDIILMVGGRVGKDGIHGATFSSEELNEGSPVTAVQIGDPITQKKMSDFLLEARDLGLYKSITDNGAGGLSSSVGEMCLESNGAELWLEKVPLKYHGLAPWEILISEAQERMTVGVSFEKVERFILLAKRRGVEATAIGKFTNSGRFLSTFKGKHVTDIDLKFLHEGLPRMSLNAKWKTPIHPEPKFTEPKDLNIELKKLLSRPNICSKETTVRQYDHEVLGGSCIKPFVGINNDGPSDAAVIRPILDSDEGLVVSHGICPRYSDIDTYHMTQCAVDEAIRNHVACGGDLKVLAGLDNFCWCDPVKSEKTPDGEYKLAQLVRANQALFDVCIAYGVPLISGKDSMKNDYMIDNTKISIPPTILFSTVGKIDDVKKAVTMDAKNPGDLVYVLGKTKNELGASEYFAMHGAVGNIVPKVDFKTAKKLYENLNACMKKELVASCHDSSDGGLCVSLAETAFAGGHGMELDLTGIDSEGVERNDYLLFSETQSRFIATVNPQNRKSFESIMKGCSVSLIGKVVLAPKFAIKRNKKMIINSNIAELKKAWKGTLSW